jgi:hypothetical protein
MKVRRKLFFHLSFATLIFLSSFAFAVNNEDLQRSSLLGLHGVFIAVEGSRFVSLHDTRKQLEEMLNSAGIRVLTMEEASKTKGVPFLYVKVDTLKDTGNDYFYRTRVELRQWSSLLRAPDIRVYTGTWSSEVIGVTKKDSLREAISYALRDIVYRFIYDYRTVNPRRVEEKRIED